jgi:hypothetical protein
LQKSKKFLTNEKYRTLLETVAKCPEPLRTYEIKNKMGKKYDKYVYEMIKELVPLPFPQLEFPSFNWNKIPEDKVERDNFKEILINTFGLLKIKEWEKQSDFENLNEENLDFEKNNDNNLLTISSGRHNKIIVKLELDSNGSFRNGRLRIFQGDQQEEEYKHAMVREYEKDKLYLVEKTPGDSLLLPNPDSISKYMSRYYDKKGEPIAYLTYKLNENASNELSEKYDQRNHTSEAEATQIAYEIQKIGMNRNNFKFWLNIRGLILYLLGEIAIEKQRKGNVDRKGRVHNKRIAKVLETLSECYPNEFPFLLYYKDFKKEYERLANFGKVLRNYEIKLLKEIAEELQYQVHSASIDFLNYWVIRRFSEGITYYFTHLVHIERGYEAYFREHQSIKYLSIAKVRDYILLNAGIISKYLNSECRKIKKEYNSYNKISDKDSPILFPFNY